MRARGWRALAVAATLLSAAPSWAGEAEDAFAQGQEAFTQKDYLTAYTAYKIAYKTLKDSAILFNMAQCERFLGYHDKAIASFQEFLSIVPETPFRYQVEEFIKEEEGILAQQKARNTKRMIGLGSVGAGVLLGAGGTAFAAIQVNLAKDPDSKNGISRFDQVFTLSTLGAGVALLGFGTAFYLLNQEPSQKQTDKPSEEKPTAAIIPTQDGFSAAVQFPIPVLGFFRGDP
jgi:tetratricopeptide (TPR) repeat protein